MAQHNEIKFRPKCAVKNCPNEATSRDWCHSHYSRWRNTGDVQEGTPIRRYVKRGDDGKPLDTTVQWRCLVPGCPRKGEYGKGCCQRCWQRFRRNGRVDKWRHPGVKHSGRYRLVTAHGHPLANAKGMVYEHRKALFDKIGPGPHKCYHCAAKGRTTMVCWEEVGGEADHLLWVDHLSNQPGDNSLSNLAPSCRKCNNGAERRMSDGFVSRNWQLVEIVDEPAELEPAPATVTVAAVIPLPRITVRQPTVVVVRRKRSKAEPKAA